MSPRRIFPPGPDPVMPARSTPASAAAMRASGVADAASRSPVAAAGAAFGGALGAGVEAGTAVAVPAETAITASGLVTANVSPAATLIAATVPVAGDGTSISTLSVETSTRISSAAIASPTALRHSTTVPSTTDSIGGRITSTVVAVTGAEPFSPLAAGSGAGDGAAPFDAAISPRSAPTVTVAPAAAAIVVNTPSTGDGISTSTLSVVTSRRISPASTVSPTLLRHSTTTPSVTDSPRSGRVNCVASLTEGTWGVARSRGTGVVGSGPRGARLAQRDSLGQPAKSRISGCIGRGRAHWRPRAGYACSYETSGLRRTFTRDPSAAQACFSRPLFWPQGQEWPRQRGTGGPTCVRLTVDLRRQVGLSTVSRYSHSAAPPGEAR